MENHDRKNRDGAKSVDNLVAIHFVSLRRVKILRSFSGAGWRAARLDAQASRPKARTPDLCKVTNFSPINLLAPTRSRKYSIFLTFSTSLHYSVLELRLPAATAG
jgi:hypothetical protein